MTRSGLRLAALAAGMLGLCLAAAGAEAQSQKRTTQTNDGALMFSNTACNGMTRFVVLRVGRNDAERDMMLMLTAGQSVKVAVPKGSTWRGSCGQPPRNEDQFAWIPLEEVF
ncbi:MAG: hypothetical protein U1E23_05070 [Reyranellaceae bacterium]